MIIIRKGLLAKELTKESIKDAKFPKKYFDFKAFRCQLKEKSSMIKSAEKEKLNKMIVKKLVEKRFNVNSKESENSRKPKEKMTVEDFFKKFKLPRGEEISSFFENLENFLCSEKKDFLRIPGIKESEISMILKKIDFYLFAAGKKRRLSECSSIFPIENGKEWTSEEDEKLLKFVEELGPLEYGTPWSIISLAMNNTRTPEEVHLRCLDLIIRKRNSSRKCEIVFSSAFKPLLMNRMFKILPPRLFIIPSETSFSLAPLPDEIIPNESRFKIYRDPQLFE